MDIKKEIKKISESKTSMGLLCAIAVAIAALLIFSAGIAVGYHKATFGRAWDEHYRENFAPHGAEGKIIEIDSPNVIILGKDNLEKVVQTDDDTKIQKENDNISFQDLKLGDSIIVIGTPEEQGTVEAKLIRVIPN